MVAGTGPSIVFQKYLLTGSYLVNYFPSNGAWEMYINKLLDNGRRKVHQLHKVISNRNINLSAHRLL